MESWRKHNYYTRDPAKWVVLMNLSTSEWNIGPLPPNVVAIPGQLNASYSFPPGTFVIQHASQARFGSRDIEKVIFGATSGLVVLWALCWVGWHIWKGYREGSGATSALLQPRGSMLPAEEYGEAAADSSMLELGAMGDDGPIPASKFEAELKVYYDNVRTELEMYEKNLRTDGVDAEDVEGGTELLRRWYDTQLGIYSMQNTQGVPQREIDEMPEQRDALLADVKKLVAGWSAKQRNNVNVVAWTPEELDEVKQLKALLDRRQPGLR